MYRCVILRYIVQGGHNEVIQGSVNTSLTTREGDPDQPWGPDGHELFHITLYDKHCVVEEWIV